MTAGLRFGIAAAAALIALAPAAAQDAQAPATNTPAPDSVGPRELEGFSLNGTVTRQAETPAQTAAPAPAPTRSAPATTSAAPRRDTASSATTERPAPAPTRETARPQRSVNVSLPPAEALSDAPSAPSTVAAPPAPAGSDFEPAAPPPSGGGGVLPWFLALLVAAGAAGFYFWRQRAGPSYAAAGAQRFVAPEPVPAAPPVERSPTPQPARRAPPPQPVQRSPEPQPAPGVPAGIVSTRLRPWLDIEFTPARCVVAEDKATIDFDVIVTNNGSSPARDVLIEASLFNAGPTQDKEIGGFFEHPVAKGDRIPAIPPYKKVQLKSAVSLTKAQIRQFEAAGRRLFVPLIGFNALYSWSGGDGQTSTSYLLGRETSGEKLAPFRLDLGPRIFRGLGARQHSLQVRN